ncbi:MAG: hypothetical protein J6K46_00405 [Sutterella sp.]|nr:hypothetical protein [Sutterella sp.]
MSMTHYMELLMINSPWNLLIFMALPVVLAETIAITELVILYSRTDRPFTSALNRFCGIAAGLVFLGIAVYLVPTVVVPVSQAGEWRTWIDWLAVYSYLAAGIPMILIALLNVRVILRRADEHARRGFHVLCVAVFLVLSHVAMIAGMADPAVAGWTPPPSAVPGMHGGHAMHGHGSPAASAKAHCGHEVPAPAHAHGHEGHAHH